MAGTNKQNQAVRWGGLLMVAAMIGGLVVGFNLLTIGLFAIGAITLVAGLLIGRGRKG